MGRVLVTGGAGFIGSHLVDALVARGDDVAVVDSFDDLYDPALKEANLAPQRAAGAVRLWRGDLADPAVRDRLATEVGPCDAVVHLAAKAGVRASFADPAAYHRANVVGTDHAAQLALRLGARRLVHASSSSVYGANPRLPWRDDDPELRPISPYAASKVASEAVAHAYHHSHGLAVAVLRLFTVYGPRQRPDLAVHGFARRITAGEPITVFGDGTSARDYTYVGDVVAGLQAALDRDLPPFTVCNLGSATPVPLHALIAELERALGAEATIDWGAPQVGDVHRTHAALDRTRDLLGWTPTTPLCDGLAAFAAWFAEHPAQGLPPRPPGRSAETGVR